MATSIRRSKSLAVSVERRVMCRVEVSDMASGEPNWPVPMKAIGAQNLLTMPGGVSISGYLHKRGGKQLQLFKWPLRYVIIHKGCVYYFKTSTSTFSQGAFSLNGYNRVMRAAEETTSNNVFPFKMAHISKKHRTWYFSAASEDERKRWMLALRKEIDHYHEKKETITDLSESGSDSDSFYGSVERPVAIKYVHNPADDSWQDDEDDDEEDYVKPDAIDDGAPSYPPPPVPRGKADPREPKAEEQQIRHFIPVAGMPKPPPPAPTKVISNSDLKWPRKDSTVPFKFDPDVKPPPIPPFSPAHKPFEFKPPPPLPINNATDWAVKLPTRPSMASSGFSMSCDINPPSFQSPSQRRDSSVSSSKNELTNCLTSNELHSIPPNSMIGNKQLKEELCNLLRKPPSPPATLKPAALANEKLPRHLPAPLPPSKPSHMPAPVTPSTPSHMPAPVTPNKPSHMPAPVPPGKPRHMPASILPNKPSHIPPPVPPAKPPYLSRSTEDNIPPLIPRAKPNIPINEDKSLEPSSSLMKTGPIRPPLVISRVRPPKPDTENIGFSPMLRSPPDGQSFIDKTMDTPVRPGRSRDVDEGSDSDDDYEKVSLPPSVFVDTCESFDVERMFKAMAITGNPLNGLFCIRNSAKAGKVIVVWDKEDGKTRNYRIFEKDTKVYLEGQILFTDISALVEHYYRSPLPGHNTLVLKHAYGCMNGPR
ncbi:PREDICTED: SH3 domain-binding protein 2 [Nanorana parkeri]|uniref:SH3 domain-binding protein 2 n=1 Tax=Nanorana parkeri TaxID=125878 RepID=UPI0008542398|nr:PREDICTED: SH3 domain-binding protein 2 [Nanorana parkeri]